MRAERALPARHRIIMVVDDDPEIRDELAVAFSELGWGLVSAGDGREALRYLRGGPRPDVILLDLMMPVMDGYRFRDHQHRDATLATIPVIAMTAGRPVPSSAQLGIPSIAKPFRIDSVALLIDEHLGAA